MVTLKNKSNQSRLSEFDELLLKIGSLIHNVEIDNSLFQKLNKILSNLNEIEYFQVLIKDQESSNFIKYIKNKVEDEKVVQRILKKLLLTNKKTHLRKQDLKALSTRNNIPQSVYISPLKNNEFQYGYLIGANFTGNTTLSKKGTKVLDFIADNLSSVLSKETKITDLEFQTARLKAIFESSHHLIWTVDTDFSIKSFNRNYYNTFLKWDTKPTINIDTEGGLKEYDFYKFWDKKYKECLEGISLNFEIKIIHEQIAKPLWFEVFLNPVNLDGEKVIEISGIANDITQRKKDSKELTKAKNLAEESLKIKEKFLANISHEIRTPLNGIMGTLELLKQSSLNKKQNKYLQSLEFSSRSLLNLVNDILDLSTIEAGKLNIRKSLINLPSLLKNVKDFYGPLAKEKNINLNFKIDKKLPETIYSDQNRMNQILSNLLSNALKFTQKKGKVDVEVKALKQNDSDLQLKFKVSDTGIGISKKKQKRIFSSFTQLNSGFTKEHPGSGLGLAISKELVRLLGGEIGVNSQKGKGSTFWFYIPVKHGEGLNEKKSIGEPIRKKIKFKESPEILLIEDNKINRVVSGEILKNTGAKVEFAKSGKEGLKKIRSKNYDLIFMDIQMPQMDGVETLEKITKMKKPAPPIIAMTAYSAKEDKKKFISLGFNDFIGKPIKGWEILEKLEKFLLKKPDSDDKEVSDRSGSPLHQNINFGTLNSLLKHCDKKVIIESLKDFEKEAEELIISSLNAKKTKNYKKILTNLHTLKGNAGTLGVEKLAEKAQGIENKIKNNNYKNLNKELDFLKLTFKEFQKTLKDVDQS